MPVIHATLQGRTGNQILQWLYCKGLATHYGFDLKCEPWIGERIFSIESSRYAGPVLHRHNELGIQTMMELGQDVEFRGYAQMTRRMIGPTIVDLPATCYTKRQAQQWLTFRPEILASLERIREHHFKNDRIVIHQRKGDYIDLGYPVVSRACAQSVAASFFGPLAKIHFVCEESPTPHHDLPDDLSFLADFYRLMKAPTLMRANSSFSWLAGLLSDGIVLSPRIDGLTGGIEHDDVRFEVGNHPRLSSHDFCSDLYVSP